MGDNTTLQTTPATPPSGAVIAARQVSYSGDTAFIAPVGLVAFAGADDAKTVFDLGAESGYHVVAGASTNAANVKASPGIVRAVRGFNKANYPVYVKLHNTAGAPTPGVGVVATFGIQAGQPLNTGPMSRYFSTGIGITITKNLDDGDTTAVAASDCSADIDYV